MPSVVKSMFDQVEQLVCLLLTNPANNAEAERSFSSLLSAQIENLCAKLYEPGASYNHCAVLHVHQYKLDALDIDEIVS